RNSNSSSFLLASFKMSISNPKIRFVLFTNRVGSRTLFVDVLLFSFQGSFVCLLLSVFVVLPTAL
ncbi:hypothetical protein, partial [Sporosarcina highlanderae]